MVYQSNGRDDALTPGREAELMGVEDLRLDVKLG